MPFMRCFSGEWFFLTTGFAGIVILGAAAWSLEDAKDGLFPPDEFLGPSGLGLDAPLIAFFSSGARQDPMRMTWALNFPNLTMKLSLTPPPLTGVQPTRSVVSSLPPRRNATKSTLNPFSSFGSFSNLTSSALSLQYVLIAKKSLKKSYPGFLTISLRTPLWPSLILSNSSLGLAAKGVSSRMPAS